MGNSAWVMTEGETLSMKGGTLTGSLNLKTGSAYQYNGASLAYIVPNAGGDNIFLGESGNFATTGYSNLGNGPNALAALTTGADNIALGMNAGASLTGGNVNTAIGMNALNKATTANYNTVVGYGAGGALTTGSSNIALGMNALVSETTGASNVAVGYLALYQENGGGANVAVGQSAGYDITTGANNTIIGANTGRGITTGGNNTVIGAGLGSLAAGLASAIILGSGGVQRYDFGVTTANVHTFSAAVRLSKGYTVAALPASPAAGATAYVTDGTAALAWGAAVTGGGSTPYLVWYNGVAWTVAGK